jgi:hypothetical protein
MNQTETKFATEGQVTFAQSKGIEGVTAETERSVASQRIRDWCVANPLPEAQRAEVRASKRESRLAALSVESPQLHRRLTTPPTEAQVKRLNQLYKGSVVATSMAQGAADP